MKQYEEHLMPSPKQVEELTRKHILNDLLIVGRFVDSEGILREYYQLHIDSHTKDQIIGLLRMKKIEISGPHPVLNVAFPCGLFEEPKNDD